MAGKRFGKPRASGEPSGSTERKIRILLELIRNKSVNLATLEDDYGIAERSLLRDFQELRNIGARAGFKISEKAENGRMRLLDFDARPTALDQSGRKLYSLIKNAAKALGQPVEAEVESIADRESSDEEPFLHFPMPTLIDGGAITERVRALEGAWRGHARVRFRYSNKERRVEPYAIIVRAGRYYLVARDMDARDSGWRHFALDRIEGAIARIGTFTPKAAPQEMVAPDAIGWMSGGKRTHVSVWISATVAASAASRKWQRGQRIENNDDGSVVITLSTNDVDEVIRWALGFGQEARIIAPSAAVERARALTREIAERYR
ncbi:MAG: WYL domain-containing protein [Candidatus Eremiobacteraeota bacterium]|nr:WYL domain-containing protein [Candidatus Eremiobacteraeota bacterium]